MRFFSSLVLFTFVTGCYDAESTVGGPEPREACTTSDDDDRDGFLNDADQDCWPPDATAPEADAGTAPVDAGSPAVDSGMPPASGCARGTVDVLVSWLAAEAGPTTINGCWGTQTAGGAIVCEGPAAEWQVPLVGCSAPYANIACTLQNVPVGLHLRFIAQVRTTAGNRWSLEGPPATVTARGALSVREDRDCNRTFETVRSSDVRVVAGTGGGSNHEVVVGR